MCDAPLNAQTSKYFVQEFFCTNNGSKQLPSHFAGSREAKKMASEDLNKVLLHTVPNSWEKQSYIHGCDFEGKTHKETCDIFEHMVIAEQLY